MGSWGLNLFVLFELNIKENKITVGSWGLNLFVLFEQYWSVVFHWNVLEDWIYLYYLNGNYIFITWLLVLEDWIYLYYLNWWFRKEYRRKFLRIEFICIIWTYGLYLKGSELFLRIEFICIIWTFLVIKNIVHTFLRIEFICIIWTSAVHLQAMWCSWGLNLFVLFEL